MDGNDTIIIQNAPSANAELTNDYFRNNLLTRDQFRIEQQQAFQRYIDESKHLRNDIGRLQSDLNRQRNRQTNVIPIPIVIPTKTERIKQIQDTILLRDTIRIKDTIHIKDTVSIIKTDTVTKTLSGEIKTIYIPADPIRDTVKQAFDFTTVPSDIFLFDVGKSAIRSVYYKRINYIAEVLKQRTELKASISGHTDPTGSVQINKLLSEKRAETIKKYLVSKGVPGQQLITNSYSFLDPAVSGNSNSSNSQNRRVVVKIEKK